MYEIAWDNTKPLMLVTFYAAAAAAAMIMY